MLIQKSIKQNESIITQIESHAENEKRSFNQMTGILLEEALHQRRLVKPEDQIKVNG